MNAARLAILAELAALTAAYLSGAATIQLTAHEIHCIVLEQAEPWEKTPAFQMFSRRTDAAGEYELQASKAARDLRAAKLAAHFAAAAKA